GRVDGRQNGEEVFVASELERVGRPESGENHQPEGRKAGNLLQISVPETVSLPLNRRVPEPAGARLFTRTFRRQFAPGFNGVLRGKPVGEKRWSGRRGCRAPHCAGGSRIYGRSSGTSLSFGNRRPGPPRHLLAPDSAALRRPDDRHLGTPSSRSSPLNRRHARP